MASPVHSTYTVAAGQPIYAGRNAPSGATGSLSGAVTLRPLTVTGSFGPPPVNSFSVTGATGTYVGNVWAPGRDSSGVVSQASWNLVPSGQWSKVSGTRIDALQSQIVAAIPSWRDYGTWNGFVNGWCGVAQDPAGSRLWSAIGGGHSDSSNNGTYMFEAFKMAWIIEQMPSDPAPWSAAYINSGSYTVCPDSQAQTATGPINDWSFDELFWDRRPTSRHTYSTPVYLPDYDKIVITRNRMWHFNRSTKTWDYKRRINDDMSAGSNPFSEHGISFYDEVTHEILSNALGSGSLIESLSYNMQTATWGSWSPPWANYTNSMADCRYGRDVTLIAPPENPNGAYRNTGRYWKFNLDSRSVTAFDVGVQYAAGLAQTDFSQGGFDGPSMVYVPTINRYWLIQQTFDASMGWFELDPTTSPWTLSRKVFSGGNPPITGSLPRRKMTHMPNLGTNGSIVWLDLADKEMWIYKL